MTAAAPPPPDPNSLEAQPLPEPGAPDLGAPPANAITSNKVAQSGKLEGAGNTFAHFGLAASLDKAATAIDFGGKLQLSRGWMVGLDAEWNPWVSIERRTMRSGVLNVFGSVVRRYQMRYQSVNLRTTVAAGASILLFDLYGARSGSVGPFVGVSLLGLEWKVVKNWYLVIDPSYVALPVPHLQGVPLTYLQYRAAIGLETAF